MEQGVVFWGDYKLQDRQVDKLTGLHLCCEVLATIYNRLKTQPPGIKYVIKASTIH